MRSLIAARVVAILVFGATACGGTSGAPVDGPLDRAATSVPTIDASDVPPPSSGGAIAVSDEVPSTEELRSLGLGADAAECFIERIDPDGNGRVDDETLFLEAFSSCS